ncbi:N-acetyltransferase [Erythrobacter alti]|uniref:GNAT family N-acetyltransferase n=1 Tax=Erythrobacter alti TaxID=1896145 RepID=UPI0030F40C58
MILRPASLSDAENLAQLGRHSFCAAFEHLYRPEDLSTFLEQAYSVDAVSREIADPSITHCLALDNDGGSLTGFVKVKQPSGYEEYSDAANPLGLGQLYCAPDRLGEGIGAALMDWALAEAKSRSCDAIQLSVWSENFGAQRFYARYGFTKIADIDFWVGKQRDDEFLYELRWKKGE